MYTDIEDIPRVQVANEWDGGWFCDICDSLNHFKIKAYKVGSRKLCRACAEKEVERNATNKTRNNSKTL